MRVTGGPKEFRFQNLIAQLHKDCYAHASSTLTSRVRLTHTLGTHSAATEAKAPSVNYVKLHTYTVLPMPQSILGHVLASLNNPNPDLSLTYCDSSIGGIR